MSLTQMLEAAGQGGTVEVELGEQTFLTGPAVVVAKGELLVPSSLAVPIAVG